MTNTDPTSQDQINKSIGMCRLHGLHNTEATLRALSAERDALKAELAESVEVIEKAYREGWSDGAADEIHEYGSNPHDEWLVSDTRRAFLARHQKETDT